MTTRWQRMTSLSNPWRGVEFAAWTALAMGVASAIVFSVATRDAQEGKVPSLLYPYLAASSIFATTCVWILMAARPGVSPAQIQPEDFDHARKVSAMTFAGIFIILCFAGLAGEPGANAVRKVNAYLFAAPHWNQCPFMQKYGLPFAAVAATGNALALSTLVYLGTLCNALVLAASRRVPGDRDPLGSTALHLRDLVHRLQRYLVMASALMVTSTLTLYLLFGAADQLPANAPAAQVALSAATGVCDVSFPGGERLQCTTMPDSPVGAQRKGSPNSAYMALVCGLSFTGALFVLFTACSSAIDDRVLLLTRNAHAMNSQGFDSKAFLERYGLDRAGLQGQMMQGLAVLAPALAGLLTLLTS